MKLQERLAELRRERKITLRELRERIEQRTGEKLSVSYLSELERTDAYPSVETLARVARGYELTLQQLLAPVDFPDNTGDNPGEMGGYPAVLRTLSASGQIDAEWAATLSRIEFRGRRPETQAEWIAIYGVLKALLEPKLQG